MRVKAVFKKSEELFASINDLKEVIDLSLYFLVAVFEVGLVKVFIYLKEFDLQKILLARPHNFKTHDLLFNLLAKAALSAIDLTLGRNVSGSLESLQFKLHVLLANSYIALAR